MDIAELTEYLKRIQLLASPDISLLGSGESNINYLATEGTTQYVVRTRRRDTAGDSRFEIERHFMLFIEACGIDFAPRSVYYDELKDIHIVSYVEGDDTSIAKLNEKQINLFTEQLKTLNSITYDNYLIWCKQTGQSPRQPQTLALRNKVNLDDRLHAIQEVSSSSPFAKAVVSWAVPKLDVLHAAEKAATLKPVFLHNDLRWTEYGGNLKISGDRLYFIDWELSGFSAEAVPEIGDVLGSIPYTPANKAILRRLYNSYTADGLSREQLDASIAYGVLWGKLGNPLWAAERYLIFTRQNHPDVDRYRRWTEAGMKDAEYFFDTPLEQWFR